MTGTKPGKLTTAIALLITAAVLGGCYHHPGYDSDRHDRHGDHHDHDHDHDHFRGGY
jgi:hypothetical protein